MVRVDGSGFMEICLFSNLGVDGQFVGPRPKKEKNSMAEITKKPTTRKKTSASASATKEIAPKRKATSKVTAISVSHEEIARLAHQYWTERGGQHGSDAADWLRAEQELRGKAS
jgi:hypothetical protein